MFPSFGKCELKKLLRWVKRIKVDKDYKISYPYFGQLNTKGGVNNDQKRTS